MTAGLASWRQRDGEAVLISRRVWKSHSPGNEQFFPNSRLEMTWISLGTAPGTPVVKPAAFPEKLGAKVVDVFVGFGKMEVSLSFGQIQ